MKESLRIRELCNDIMNNNGEDYCDDRFLLDRFSSYYKDHYGDIIKDSKFKDSIFDIFYDGNGMYYSLDKILNDDRINDLDKSLLYCFVGSKSFLDSIDMNNLSSNGKKILRDILRDNLDKEIMGKEKDVYLLDSDCRSNILQMYVGLC